MSSHVQSVLFDRAEWQVGPASRWLTTHGFKVKKVDATEKFYRFRQRKPNATRYRYRLKRVGDGITFILGFGVND